MPSDFTSTCMSTLLIIELDRPAAQILDDADALVGNDHAHDVRFAGGLAPCDFFRRVAAAESVVARGLARGALRDAHLLETLRRAETLESVAAREQLLGILAIDRGAFALAIGTVRAADVGSLVPVETAPAQRLEDRALALGGAARLIGILDAQE